MKNFFSVAFMLLLFVVAGNVQAQSNKSNEGQSQAPVPVVQPDPNNQTQEQNSDRPLSDQKSEKQAIKVKGQTTRDAVKNTNSDRTSTLNKDYKKNKKAKEKAKAKAKKKHKKGKYPKKEVKPTQKAQVREAQ